MLTATVDDPDPSNGSNLSFLWQVLLSTGQVLSGTQSSTSGSGGGEGEDDDLTFEFVPSDNGLYTVTFTVTDHDDGDRQYVDTLQILVDNVAPHDVSAGPDRVVAEGDQVTFQATFLDPGGNDTHTCRWEVVSDNGQVVPDGGEPMFAFTPVNQGTYIVRLTVTDDEGLSGTDETIVTVNNAAPEDVDAGPDLSINEGQLVELDVNFTDPGNWDTHTFVWSVASDNGQVIPEGDEVRHSSSHQMTTAGTRDRDGNRRQRRIVLGRSRRHGCQCGTGQCSVVKIVRWQKETWSVCRVRLSIRVPTIRTPSCGKWSPTMARASSPAHDAAFQFRPGDNGIYAVTLTVTDNAGAAAQDTVVVTANNLAPANRGCRSGPSSPGRGRRTTLEPVSGPRDPRHTFVPVVGHGGQRASHPGRHTAVIFIHSAR